MPKFQKGEDMKDMGEMDEKDGEFENDMDEGYIQKAAKAVGDLMPSDFKPMSGMKIPTEAEDGEEVKLILVGKAKDGFLTGVKAAECMPEMEEEEEEKPKGRIKIMIMGDGNGEEE